MKLKAVSGCQTMEISNHHVSLICDTTNFKEYLSWRRNWQPTPVFLPGESHGPRNLVGYSPRGGKE